MNDVMFRKLKSVFNEFSIEHHRQRVFTSLYTQWEMIPLKYALNEYKLLLRYSFEVFKVFVWLSKRKNASSGFREAEMEFHIVYILFIISKEWIEFQAVVTVPLFEIMIKIEAKYSMIPFARDNVSNLQSVYLTQLKTANVYIIQTAQSSVAMFS